MASCQTARWVSTAPYVRLTVTESASTGGSSTLSWVLEYYADSAARTSIYKEYSVTLAGSKVSNYVGLDIDGITGWYEVESGTKTITKTSSAQTISFGVSFSFNLTWSGVYGGTKTASGSITVPAKSSYTISYNANGGSGAPSAQTKWYGTAITLSSTKPTRTGYAFQGWATSASGSVAYAAGASYTANANVTLYAVWKANTYTVKYNANGGSGAPGNQTKTYGVTLTLSSTKPTRTNYNFLGWATSASATTATYAAGGSYTANAAITLYAVWELGYVKPRLFNLSANRCNASGVLTDEGTCALIACDWETDNTVSSITVAWKSGSAGSGSATISASGTSGSVSQVVGNSALSAEASYTITVTVADSMDSNSAVTTLNGSKFTFDAKAGGDGVSFGKPAELGAAESLGGNGVADFAFDAKFNEPVYGKALGMDKLPAIPANSDFNDYMEPGCYAVQSNAIAATIVNIPVDRAGRLEVWSATGEGVRLEQWSYLRQRFIPYNSGNAVWERELTRGEDNVWNYYEWWKSSLTPDASEKVYAKAAMTISLSANTTSSDTGAYTQIPLNTTVLSTSGRLTLENNSIRVGSNISHIKVSGQALLKCASTTGNRHIRIQKVSGSTTSSVAWVCVYGVATSNTLYPCTPVIVSVKEGDLLKMVYYTSDSSDYFASGSAANGWQTYLTVEEL